ncbi:MAG: hypothetical protein ACLFQV_00320 [Vulcanimicrobiota bacterium]
MISLENLVDKKIFLVLRDIESFSDTGLDSEKLVATLKGYEKRRGIWIELESVSQTALTVKGKDLADCKAFVFIPWSHIATIVHYPDKEGLEVKDYKAKKIGFR